MATTNMSTVVDQEVDEKARALLAAAYDYWEVHQRKAGGGAVIWLKDDMGQLVVFTRGEYLNTIMSNIDHLWDEKTMTFPTPEIVS